MRSRFMVALTAALLCAVAIGGITLATPGSGVTSTTLAQGFADDLDTKVKTDKWMLKIDATSLGSELTRTQVAVIENRVAPGGHFGWHSHPGVSIVVVKSGVSTFYRGDDPTCTPHVHPAGTAYTDPGGSVHIARNEGDVELVLLVTRIIPEGATPRIDEPDPGTCQF
ncbi:MAG: cupin domain-containing protein [Chloroflexota bacterium]|nr:cupin domain-containing protein [Chloroflexota bacterium]